MSGCKCLIETSYNFMRVMLLKVAVLELREEVTRLSLIDRTILAMYLSYSRDQVMGVCF